LEELQINLHFQCTPAESTAVRQEIAFRIQAFNPDWIVTAAMDEHEIRMRRVDARNQAANAGGFNINEVHRDALQHAETAISEVVRQVQAHFSRQGRTRGFEVPFNSGTPFYVLEQTVLRMQYYTNHWHIVADRAKHAISCHELLALPDL
jgi:hypothetical protein